MKRYPNAMIKDKETLVTLHIKNNSTREIEKVLLKDHIPPVASVVKDFDTIAPEIRITHKGTDLIWKIDKLKPKEERIFTYKIKPMVDVQGKLKLPKAYFTYKSGKTIIHKITEKVVTTTKKIK